MSWVKVNLVVAGKNVGIYTGKQTRLEVEPIIGDGPGLCVLATVLQRKGVHLLSTALDLPANEVHVQYLPVSGAYIAKVGEVIGSVYVWASGR